MRCTHSSFRFSNQCNSTFPSKNYIYNEIIWFYPENSLCAYLFSTYRFFMKNAFPMRTYAYLVIKLVKINFHRSSN